MKDKDARGIVLRALYDIRHTHRHAGIPADVPGLEKIESPVLVNILRQLNEKGLITFQSLSGGDQIFGRGEISAYGVDVIEGESAPPIAITIDNSVNVHSSQNVMVGGSGNTQSVTMDVEKLFNAVDGAEASATEKAEAKSLLKMVLDNPIAKKALDWLFKSQVGG
ncbi:hypothetical protein EDE08_101627 [Bradyrhizobium sp. R2.2-H]|jgi:hypothetical protein|uniref:hypothetical protein n=1 Tax=unclassified Bradyrhizobium TaxID=2631580 RepID=UPI001046B611|nr:MULTISPECIES: hypothetical protein [unclassified Bradyrhizobium]TCU78845.1 hypothetical protein EDE10_101628 [Bradyrhizobium sp. Y-H1]TCU80928.1 hypothetical protein EDE08_101627 [Bradyrhizobium sp. R2.2-H]